MSGISDPIADLLTRIRNGISSQLRYVDVDTSNLKVSIVKILKEQGYISNFLVKQDGCIGKMRIFLKYGNGRNPVIQGLKRISKPGLRCYIRHNRIPKVLGGMGIAILSTSQGILAGHDARRKKVGGELLCYVW